MVGMGVLVFLETLYRSGIIRGYFFHLVSPFQYSKGLFGETVRFVEIRNQESEKFVSDLPKQLKFIDEHKASIRRSD